MRYLIILIFALSIKAGNYSINKFNSSQSGYAVYDNSIMSSTRSDGELIVLSYAPTIFNSGQLVMRMRFGHDNYTLYSGSTNSDTYNKLSAFRLPGNISYNQALTMKFYDSPEKLEVQDLAKVYFDGAMIYTENNVKLFYNTNGVWKSLEIEGRGKSKYNVFYDVIPADFSLFIDNNAPEPELSKGTHNFRFTAPGYKFFDTSLVILSDTTIQCKLEKASATLKVLAKNSANNMYLAGVSVSVNGTPRGKAPLTIELLSGVHRISLSKNGYQTIHENVKVGSLPIEKGFVLKPTSTATVQTASRSGKAKVISITSYPSGAKVYASGQYLGKTPVVWKNPPIYGDVTFTYKKSGYLDVQKSAQYFEKSLSVHAKLVSNVARSNNAGNIEHVTNSGEGSIFISSLPPMANILLNGKRIGVTNKDVCTLPVGTHSLTFVKGNKRTTQKVVINSGKNTSILVRLNSSSSTRNSEKGSIFITSLPPMANIFYNGRQIGKANVEAITLPTGRHTLTLKHGSKSATQTVVLRAGKNGSKMVRLQ